MCDRLANFLFGRMPYFPVGRHCSGQAAVVQVPHTATSWIARQAATAGGLQMTALGMVDGLAGRRGQVHG
jgi:hypothetical protein